MHEKSAVDHDALLLQLRQLNLLVRSACEWREIHDALTHFREGLREHFLSEEQSWSWSQVASQNEVLAETIRGFESEHARMLQICHSLELTGGERMSSCRDGFETLASMLRLHEREEKEILPRMFEDDSEGAG